MSKTINYKAIIAFVLGMALAAGAVVFAAGHAVDKRTSLSPNFEELVHWVALNATTTNATSSAIYVGGAKKANAYFIHRGSTGVGTTTFYIEVSPNGTDWYDYNKLISNTANTNSQEVTRVASVAQNGTTSALYALDLGSDTFRNVRCVTTEASTTISAVDDATCEITVEE